MRRDGCRRHVTFLDLHLFIRESKNYAYEERMHIATSSDETNSVPFLNFNATKVFHGVRCLALRSHQLASAVVRPHAQDCVPE